MAIGAEQYWMLLVFVVANFAISGLASHCGARRSDTGTWFADLVKPAAFPAEWVFEEAWCVVLLCTGIAGWEIWRHLPGPRTGMALVLYGLQLLTNVAWQSVVMGQHRLGRGVAFAVLLAATITLTLFYTMSAVGRSAFWLLPYWLWTVYGINLNYRLWRANQAVSVGGTERVS